MRPAFLPLLNFFAFYRLEVYSVAYMRLGDLLVSSGIITGEQLEQALALPREDGFTTLRESCRELVLAGVTSAAEAARVINTAAET